MRDHGYIKSCLYCNKLSAIHYLSAQIPEEFLKCGFQYPEHQSPHSSLLFQYVISGLTFDTRSGIDCYIGSSGLELTSLLLSLSQEIPRPPHEQTRLAILKPDLNV